MAMLRFWTYPFRIVPLLALLTVACAAQAPTPEPVTDQETELGQAMYEQLRDKGEIVEFSPLYETGCRSNRPGGPAPLPPSL